jgi:hypothetical protein
LRAAAIGRAHAEQVDAPLEWTCIRRLDGLLQGDYRTLMRGSGLDPGRPAANTSTTTTVRHIDWNVTAGLQVPHVRVFTEDREMASWFLLDLSPSVDFGSGEQRKHKCRAEFRRVSRECSPAMAPRGCPCSYGFRCGTR